MGRKILFVTTDQQRYDTLGCNGGTLARTPVVDALAAAGHPLRAGPPAVGRVHAVALDDHHRPAPEHARRVDERRAAAGRRAVGRGACCTTPATAPRSSASRTSSRSSTRSPASPRTASRVRPGMATAPHRGFEHLEFGDPRRRRDRCTTPAGWPATIPRRSAMFYPVLDGDARGQRGRRWRHRRAAGAGQPDPARVVPHRLGGRSHDRVARLARRRRRLVLLDELPRPAPSVGSAAVGGRPHRLARRAAAGRLHRGRGRRRERDPRRQAAPLAALVRRPLVSNYEAPADWVPATLTADQVREVNARNAVECELIDEALGRVLAPIAGAGWGDDVDVVFTTDHGELQGDFGLLFKGPYHVDGLMRLPLIWRPAPSAGVDAGGGHATRSGSSTSRRRSAPSPASPRPTGCRAAACRSTTPTPTPRLRAGADRVGQRAVRRRRAPAHDHPRRLGVHARTGPATSTTAPRASCTTSPTTRCSGATAGTTRRCAALRSDLLADLWDHQPVMHAPLRRVEAPV